MDEIEGWIDEVEDGIVWGRVLISGEEFEFWTPILCVPECQRVDLQPGMYCAIVNGHLLLHKTQWTTHEIEQADREARRLAAAFNS